MKTSTGIMALAMALGLGCATTTQSGIPAGISLKEQSPRTYIMNVTTPRMTQYGDSTYLGPTCSVGPNQSNIDNHIELAVAAGIYAGTVSVLTDGEQYVAVGHFDQNKNPEAAERACREARGYPFFGNSFDYASYMMRLTSGTEKFEK